MCVCFMVLSLTHTTDKCEVMKDQAEKMKAMYKAQTPAECAKKHQEWKAKKAPTCNKINEMVAESVKESVKEIFQTHMKTLKKCNREDTDSDSGLEHENYHMDDVSLDLKDINVAK